MPSVWLDKMLDARGVANVGPIMDGKPLDDPADTAASRTRLGPGKLTSRGSAQSKSELYNLGLRTIFLHPLGSFSLEWRLK